MTRKILLLSTVAMLTVFLVSPASAGFFGRGVKGNGDMTTVSYDLDDCDQILLSCGLDVDIVFGDVQKIELTVDENLVDLYVLEVDGGTLLIDTEKSTRANKRTKLSLTLTSLTDLRIEGAGDIDIEAFDGRELSLVVEGAGDLDIDGEVGNLDVRVDGAGDINAKNLHARDVEVEINGAGDIKVYATDSADVTINGVGDVDVYGKPDDFTKSIHGIGDIDRH